MGLAIGLVLLVPIVGCVGYTVFGSTFAGLGMAVIAALGVMSFREQWTNDNE